MMNGDFQHSVHLHVSYVKLLRGLWLILYVTVFSFPLIPCSTTILSFFLVRNLFPVDRVSTPVLIVQP